MDWLGPERDVQSHTSLHTTQPRRQEAQQEEEEGEVGSRSARDQQQETARPAGARDESRAMTGSQQAGSREGAEKTLRTESSTATKSLNPYSKYLPTRDNEPPRKVFAHAHDTIHQQPSAAGKAPLGFETRDKQPEIATLMIRKKEAILGKLATFFSSEDDRSCFFCKDEQRCWGLSRCCTWFEDTGMSAGTVCIHDGGTHRGDTSCKRVTRVVEDRCRECLVATRQATTYELSRKRR